jgi:hypothetical protein
VAQKEDKTWKKNSGLIYCRCAYQFLCEVSYYDEDLVSLVFFDDVEGSESYAEQITHCPECGQLLVEWLLETPHALKTLPA